jgi:hypothetical protein
MIIDYLDLATKYRKVAKDGFRYQYIGGEKHKLYLSEEEINDTNNIAIEYENKYKELMAMTL